MTTTERAAAVEEETGVEVSGEQTAAGAGLSDPETGDTTTSSAGPFNKGGLMQRKKRKANK